MDLKVRAEIPADFPGAINRPGVQHHNLRCQAMRTLQAARKVSFLIQVMTDTEIGRGCWPTTAVVGWVCTDAMT